jgi:hypothetical protein
MGEMEQHTTSASSSARVDLLGTFRMEVDMQATALRLKKLRCL